VRRSLSVAGLLIGVLLVSATPALADRRKSTVTLDVDPYGVAIQIDSTRSGEGRTPGGSGGNAGTPCIYTLASAGSGGLYADRCGATG
jgi:hypothetical protein